MSETQFCKEFSSYCASAGIFLGGGKNGQTVDLSKRFIAASYAALRKIKPGLPATASYSAMAKVLGTEWKKASKNVMMQDKYFGGLMTAHKGGFATYEPRAEFFGGLESGVEVAGGVAAFLSDSMMFLGGSISEAHEEIKAHVHAFDLYIKLLIELGKAGIHTDTPKELKTTIKEQIDTAEKMKREFNKIKGHLAPDNEFSKKLAELAEKGKLKDLKSMLKKGMVDKEARDTLADLIKLQGPAAVAADELQEALKRANISIDEFRKLKNYNMIDKLMRDHLIKIEMDGNSSAIEKRKQLEALDLIRSLAEDQVAGTQFEGGECPCESKYEGAGSTAPVSSMQSIYKGGEFMELDKELRTELAYSSAIKTYSPIKKAFMDENAKLIAEMLEKAKLAAFALQKKNVYDETNILIFLRRLGNLRMIDANRMEVFYTRGRDFNSTYIRDEAISGLKDIIDAGKVIESTVGAEMRSFIDSVEEYRKFLTKFHDMTHPEKFEGGAEIACSGINNSSVYDRFDGEDLSAMFYGGIVESTFADVIDVFNKSILLGRMQNGLNITIKELQDFSVEQDSVNASILSKQVNSYTLMAKEMIRNYDTTADAFPVSKELFTRVIKDNIMGVAHLLHAVQAIDAKVRVAHLKVIENPAAAKDLAALLSKVVIDTNWIVDPEFTSLKEFTEFFHIESVGDNTITYDEDKVFNRVYDIKFGDAHESGSSFPLSFASNPRVYTLSTVPEHVAERKISMYANNDYIKDKKRSPFPYNIRTCNKSHVSTLILVSDDGKNPVGDKTKRDEMRAQKYVNTYKCKSIFPAKITEEFSLANSSECYDINGVKSSPPLLKSDIEGAFSIHYISGVTTPTAIPRKVKFIDVNARSMNYVRAQEKLRESADTILMLRNLFSVFDTIDKAYTKGSGDAKSNKTGSIYNAIKEYLILTTMYPTIYTEGTKIMAGHIAMREFGHPIVMPAEDSKTNYADNSGDLLGDLQNLSLREYYEGRITDNYVDINWGDETPFPKNKAQAGNPPMPAINEHPSPEYREFIKGEFRNMFARCDLLLTMSLKSMYTKIMSTLSMFNLISFYGPENNLAYNQLRIIYGGVEPFSISTPNVKPENAEIYYRLFLYGMFYKQLFFEEHSPSKVIHSISGAKRMALLPDSSSEFSGIMKLFFLKWFNIRFDAPSKDKLAGNLSDADLAMYITECNYLMEKAKGEKVKQKTEYVLKQFILDINRRYGLVNTDEILEKMKIDKDEAYPGLKRMQNRAEFANRKEYKATISKSGPLLDGEDEPIDLKVPSMENEFRSSLPGRATTLIIPKKSDVKYEDLFASVYSFREKLSRMTDILTARFNEDFLPASPLRQTGNMARMGLNKYIIMLQMKLEVKNNDLDRFRIIKEYLYGNQDNLIKNISQEVLLYRELVYTPATLLFKIYIRIIAHINLYGKDQIWVEPLLRGTFLYYLNSVNTNLVDIGETGSAPMLDFSNLESVCSMFLEQMQSYHNQLRSGISPSYADSMEKNLILLFNTHRSIFNGGGLISTIEYEPHQTSFKDATNNIITDPGVKLNPLVDYSEYSHLKEVTGAVPGSNSFILDQGIFVLPGEAYTIKDPRINFINDLAVPNLTFDLLDSSTSPKNIYVLFEYLLVSIVKMFHDPYGKFYGPLMDSFVQEIRGFDSRYGLQEKTRELGDVDDWDMEMPFSKKTIAVYNMLYAYKSRADSLIENDITMLTKDQKVRIKKNLPVLLFLFKFIIKHAFLQFKMISNGNVYKPDGGSLVPTLPTAGAGGLFSQDPNFQALMQPVLGGADDKRIRPEDIKNFKKQKVKFTTDISSLRSIFATDLNEGAFRLKDYATITDGRFSKNKDTQANLFLRYSDIPVKQRSELIRTLDNLTTDFNNLFDDKIDFATTVKTIQEKSDVVKRLSSDGFMQVQIYNQQMKETVKTFFNTEFNFAPQVKEAYKTLFENYITIYKSEGIKSILTNEISILPGTDTFLNLVSNHNIYDNTRDTKVYPVKVRSLYGDIPTSTCFANMTSNDALDKLYLSEAAATTGGNPDAKFPIRANTTYYTTFSSTTDTSDIISNQNLFNKLRKTVFPRVNSDQYDKLYSNALIFIEHYNSLYLSNYDAEADLGKAESAIAYGNYFTTFFSDAVHTFQQNDLSRKYNDFHVFLDQYISDKINLIFMESAEKFLSFYFNFINRQVLVDKKLLSSFKAAKAAKDGGADIGVENLNSKANLNTLLAAQPNGAAYSSATENAKNDLIIEDEFYDKISFMCGGYSAFGVFKFHYGTENPSEIYDPYYYYGNMETIDPRVHFAQLLRAVPLDYDRADISAKNPEISSLTPWRTNVKSTHDSFTRETIYKQTLNVLNSNKYNKFQRAYPEELIYHVATTIDEPGLANQAYAANGGGEGFVNAILGYVNLGQRKPNIIGYPAINQGNNVSKEEVFSAHTSPLFNNIRDLGILLFNTAGKTLEESWMTLKLSLKEQLSKHYINDRIYIPKMQYINRPLIADNAGLGFINIQKKLIDNGYENGKTVENGKYKTNANRILPYVNNKSTLEESTSALTAIVSGFTYPASFNGVTYNRPYDLSKTVLDTEFKDIDARKLISSNSANTASIYTHLMSDSCFEYDFYKAKLLQVLDDKVNYTAGSTKSTTHKTSFIQGMLMCLNKTTIKAAAVIRTLDRVNTLSENRGVVRAALNGYFKAQVNGLLVPASFVNKFGNIKYMVPSSDPKGIKRDNSLRDDIENFYTYEPSSFYERLFDEFLYNSIMYADRTNTGANITTLNAIYDSNTSISFRSNMLKFTEPYLKAYISNAISPEFYQSLTSIITEFCEFIINKNNWCAYNENNRDDALGDFNCVALSNLNNEFSALSDSQKPSILRSKMNSNPVSHSSIDRLIRNKLYNSIMQTLMATAPGQGFISTIATLNTVFNGDFVNAIMLINYISEKYNIDTESLANIINYAIVPTKAINYFIGDNYSCDKIVASDDASYEAAIKMKAELGSEIFRIITLYEKIQKISTDANINFTGNAISTVKSRKVMDPISFSSLKGIGHIAAIHSSSGIDIQEVNVPCILEYSSGSPITNPTNDALCFGCGSRCEIPKMLQRAQNAVKYGSLIYQSLSQVLADLGEVPKYLEFTPYLKDVNTILHSEETLAPISIAIDLIPAIINTVKGDEEDNIMKSLKSESRVALGLHCNNIGDLTQMLTGMKNNILSGVSLFLLDDKQHIITLNDFPWLKSLIGSKTRGDILNANIDQSSAGSYIQNFGKLAKYLYEIEFKNMFANTFGPFNSLDSPKFQIKTTSLAANNIFSVPQTIYSNTVEIRSLKHSLPSILQYKSLEGQDASGKDLSVNTYQNLMESYICIPGREAVFAETKAINVVELIPLIEMNTNVSQIQEYMVESGGSITTYNNQSYISRVESIKTNMIENILDVGIFPINIHSMMREIPLANTINNNYSFDIIIDWLTGTTKPEGVKTLGTGITFLNKDPTKNTSRISTTRCAPADNPRSDEKYSDANIVKGYIANYCKNPNNATLIPFPRKAELTFTSNAANNKAVINSAIINRTSLVKHIKNAPEPKVGVASTNGTKNEITGIYKTLPLTERLPTYELKSNAGLNYEYILLEAIYKIKTHNVPNSDRDIKTIMCLSNIGKSVNTFNVVQYSNYPIFAVDGIVADGGSSAYIMFANPDLSVLIPRVYDENNIGKNIRLSQLISKLLKPRSPAEIIANNTSEPTGALQNGLDGNGAFSDKGRYVLNNKFGDSYYYHQTLYEQTFDDIHHGVDKNCAQPILGINIYAEMLYNVYENKFKTEFEDPTFQKYTSNSFQSGINSLYVVSNERS